VDSTLTLNYEWGKGQTGEKIAAVLFVLTAFNFFGTMPPNDLNRLPDLFVVDQLLNKNSRGCCPSYLYIILL
jgi:hypothetical protein